MFRPYKGIIRRSVQDCNEDDVVPLSVRDEQGYLQALAVLNVNAKLRKMKLPHSLTMITPTSGAESVKSQCKNVRKMMSTHSHDREWGNII